MNKDKFNQLVKDANKRGITNHTLMERFRNGYNSGEISSHDYMVIIRWMDDLSSVVRKRPSRHYVSVI